MGPHGAVEVSFRRPGHDTNIWGLERCRHGQRPGEIPYLQSGQQPDAASRVAADAVVPKSATAMATSPSNVDFISCPPCSRMIPRKNHGTGSPRLQGQDLDLHPDLKVF